MENEKPAIVILNNKAEDFTGVLELPKSSEKQVQGKELVVEVYGK